MWLRPTRYEKMAFHVVNSENSNEAVGVLAARLLLWQYVTEYVVAASVGATCVIVVLVVASSDHCMGIASILRRYSKVSFFVCVAEEAINVGPLFALGQKFSPGRPPQKRSSGCRLPTANHSQSSSSAFSCLSHRRCYGMRQVDTGSTEGAQSPPQRTKVVIAVVTAATAKRVPRAPCGRAMRS